MNLLNWIMGHDNLNYLPEYFDVGPISDDEFYKFWESNEGEMHCEDPRRLANESKK